MKNITSLIIISLFAMQYLYSQNVGIGTSNPDTELHIHDASGDNIIMQKLTTPSSETEFGFNTNIGAILGTVSNHDLRIRTNEFSRIVVSKDGRVGIGSGIPSEKLHVQDGNIFLSNLGGTNTKGLLFGESNEPVYGWIYDGLGSGSNNKLVLREYLGTESNLIEIDGNGKIKFKNLEGNTTRPLYVEPDGTITTSSEPLYYSGRSRLKTDSAFENLHLPEGAKLSTVEFKFLDKGDDEQMRFYISRHAFSSGSTKELAETSTGFAFSSTAVQTKLVSFSTSEPPVNNKDYYYSFDVLRDQGIFGTASDLQFISYRIKYTID